MYTCIREASLGAGLFFIALCSTVYNTMLVHSMSSVDVEIRNKEKGGRREMIKYGKRNLWYWHLKAYTRDKYKKYYKVKIALKGLTYISMEENKKIKGDSAVSVTNVSFTEIE